MSGGWRSEQKTAEVGVGGGCGDGELLQQRVSTKLVASNSQPIMGTEQSEWRTKQVLCNQQRAALRDEPARG